ncbi:beta-lactamase-like protein [Umbelopsis sp. AD052]|nr:beta-lactamase-like protein [Umbelopsis sp. AD052]
MSSDLKFTPISGAKNSDPLCYLLEIDEVKLLLDCGWSDKFDVEELQHFRRVAKQADALLISHADVQHLGAYPYARTHLGLSCPVFATIPVVNMGRMCMYDLHQAKVNEQEFDVFTLEDVDSAFDKITPLRYSQPTALQGKCKGITITAYSAAHTIGGTVWKIKKDTDEILYAVDYNHSRERHLGNSVLNVGTSQGLESLGRPTLMITDANNADVALPKRKSRDTALFNTLAETLRNAGSVLLPTDSSTRVLELALMLDQHWAKNQFTYPLILLTHTSYHTAHFAKVMLEWMGEDMTRTFSQTRENPFDFKYLRLCHRVEDLEKYPGPKVVLASNQSLETGFGRDLFLRWMRQNQTETDAVNTLILTDRAAPGTLAAHLYNEWYSRNSADDAAAAAGTDRPEVRSPIEYETQIHTVIHQRVPLEGEELEEYETRKRNQAEREAQQAAIMARSRVIMEEDESDASDADEPDDVNLEDLLTTQFDLYVRDAGKSGGFFKQTHSYRMFPYVERRKKFDDYGEAIMVDHYKQASDIEQIEEAMNAGTGAKFGGEDVDMDLAEPILPARDETPTKYISFEDSITVKCMLQYIDFEGLTDGRSIRNILAKIAPRKLIIVHGTPQATEYLSNALKNVAQFTNDVYTPDVGEVLNVSAATNIYRVRLTDALVTALRFSKLDDYDLARVSGRIHFSTDMTPTLDLPSSQDQIPFEPPVLVGDVRLREFRKVLQAEGITAEFKGELLLVCNDHVVVRKMGTGQLLLEGLLSPDYYKIRSLLYAQHAIV